MLLRTRHVCAIVFFSVCVFYPITGIAFICLAEHLQTVWMANALANTY